MIQKLYLKVTKDKYELPLCVMDTLKELADYDGIQLSTLRSKISNYEHGRIPATGTPYRRVIIEEDKYE